MARAKAAAKKPVAKKSAKKPAAKKPAKARAKRPVAKPTGAQELPRNLALESAIIDAPLDPLPRFVYGDWLQSVGAKRGEWVTLSAGVEGDPKNARLRAAAVAFLDDHRQQLLGAGAALLPGAWIGWRCGFIDEVRLQPYHNQRSVLRAFEALLAHPSCRFIRHLALGAMPGLQDLVDALARAAPPLLESLLLVDDHRYQTELIHLDAIDTRRLRRLGMKNVDWTKPIPSLVELFVGLTPETEQWLFNSEQTETLPVLEELTIDCRARQPGPVFITNVLNALPALRRLRFLHAQQTDELVAAIAPHIGRLEVLDCSHSDLGDSGAARLLGASSLELLALRTGVTPAMTEQLRARLRGVTVSNPIGPSIYDLRDDHTGTAWLSHRLVTEGRDALRIVPAAGRSLYSLGTNHSTSDREAQAVPMLDASITMPASDYDTWAWANAAIAHSRLREYDEAELIAREGLLRAPREPNFFAIITHALRCVGRVTDALPLLGRARVAIAHGEKSRHTGGSTNACLSGCLYTLAQAGRHDELIEFADEHRSLLDQNMQAVIAMSHVASGRMKAARLAFKRASESKNLLRITADPRRRAVLDHATAVMILAGKEPSKPDAITALARAKAAGYYDWHWIATDPNLAALRDEADFAALSLSTSPDP